MKQAQAEAYFTYLGKQSGMEAIGLEAHIKLCIEMGSNEFWNAKNWSWATRKLTLTWTTANSEQSLPADVIGFRSVRETSTPTGNKLIYKPLEEFEQDIPYPEAHPTTDPQAFTVFYDNTTKSWKVRMYNVPSSGMTTEWIVYTNEPDDIERIPNKFVGGLTLCIDKFLYKLGTPEQISAVGQYYQIVLPALEVRDDPFQGRLFRKLDSTQAELTKQVPWVRP
jgi:hypothetical protein